MATHKFISEIDPASCGELIARANLRKILQDGERQYNQIRKARKGQVIPERIGWMTDYLINCGISVDVES